MDTAYGQVEALLREMTEALPNIHPAHKLSAQISVLCRGYMSDSSELEIGLTLGLTGCERRILNLLLAAKGKIVKHDAIYDALYFDSSKHGETSINTTKVFITRVRQKLGKDWRIENIWGEGYRLKHLNPAENTL